MKRWPTPGRRFPRRPDGNSAPACGLGWYTNFDGNWENVPQDLIARAGAGNQVLMASLELDLMIIRNDRSLDGPRCAFSWRSVEEHLFDPLMEAIA